MLYLNISLRKTVETLEQAKIEYNAIVTKMADKPDIIVRATVTEHYTTEEAPE